MSSTEKASKPLFKKKLKKIQIVYSDKVEWRFFYKHRSSSERFLYTAWHLIHIYNLSFEGQSL